MILSFAKPLYLYLFLIVPALILFHFLTLKWRRRYALRFANFEAIARVKGIDLVSKNLLVLILTIIISSLVIFALAGTHLHRTFPASVFSFSIAIDTSRSMEATDFSPNRLEAAKQTALDFIDLSPAGTKIAVVSFSGNSFIEQTLTSDKPTAKASVRDIPLSTTGGTDLNEAVITSTNLLQGEEAKAVILLSDGQINVGTLDDLIAYASQNSVVVHTIGIGTVEGGETSFGLSKLDEESLIGVAFNTGGEYFNAKNEIELQGSLNSILELRTAVVAQDISSHLLIAALIIFLLEFILINTRYKILP